MALPCGFFHRKGLAIYTADGKELKKTVDPERICLDKPGYVSTSGWNSHCRFYDVVSDGKKYVWAAVSRGVSKINVFDIDTGDIVGAFETCADPSGLEYHALRDEVWVRCYDVDDDSEEKTLLDVFSASSPSVNVQTDILWRTDGLSSRGVSVIDKTLGDVGFLTDRDLPYLFKIDLSEKKILDRIAFPEAHGLYESAYSSVNKHVFVRSQVCCTCGSPSADRESCGRGSGSLVNVTTGPNA